MNRFNLSQSMLFSTILAILVSIQFTSCTSSFALPADEVYIYSLPKNYKVISGYFHESSINVTYYDLYNLTYAHEFLELVNLLAMKGVEVLPPELCTMCELSRGPLGEIYRNYASPLIVFFRNGRLLTITIAITDSEVLDQVIIKTENFVKVLAREKSYVLSDEDDRNQLEKIITKQQENANTQTDIFHILPLIIVSAAVDAINPCEFYVLIVFLSMVFFRNEGKYVLKAGIAYSIAVFIIYFLMGFGLLQLVSYVQETKMLIAILGFSIGLRALLNFIFGVFGLSLGLRDTIGTFLNKKFRRIPKTFSEKISTLLKRSFKNPLMAFVIGVIASALLLPCTSGPYLIALSLLAKLETRYGGLLLLAVYNLIIIIPFLAITVSIYTLKVRTGKMKKWFSERQRLMNLASGILMIFLSLYLLFTIIQ